MAEEASEVMLPMLLVWTRGGAGTPTAVARPRGMRRSLAIVALLTAGVRRDGQVVIFGGDPAHVERRELRRSGSRVTHHSLNPGLSE